MSSAILAHSNMPSDTGSKIQSYSHHLRPLLFFVFFRLLPRLHFVQVNFHQLGSRLQESESVMGDVNKAVVQRSLP